MNKKKIKTNIVEDARDCERESACMRKQKCASIYIYIYIYIYTYT